MTKRGTGHPQIEVTPGIAGGRPRIVGHRVRVQDVAVWHESLGLSVEEILARCPGLTATDVEAALAYYDDHREEIQQGLDQDAEIARAVGQCTPSKIAR